MRVSNGWAVAAVLSATLALQACRIDEHKNGDNKDVKIDTPFGGLHVDTNDAQLPAEIGLPVYPGATPMKSDNDNDSANVNMSFGSFQLRVKAATFRTPDSADKVEAFYRNGMKRYGDVIACRGNHPVGAPAQTAEGLTCENEKHNHITVENDVTGHKLELKAGSQQHQHVVGIDPDGSGTKIGLVALDLPSAAFGGGENSGDRQ